MLRRYKELFYGLLMLAYRVGFVVFGLALGWLLWRNNTLERNYRIMAEAFAQIQRRLGQPALLIHSKMQVLLTRTVSSST